MSTEMIRTEGTALSLFSADGFELVQRMAKAFASSTMVPKQYQGPAGIANCIIALNMAQRIGSDPLMTMQNLYVVHGTPAWSAQFLIATFNACGRFSAIDYEWEGKPGSDDWGCRAVAVEEKTGRKLVGALVTIALAKAEGWHGKAGSKWKTMPEQMLRYRAASWMVRAYAPEIAMGLHSADEIEDSYNPRPANGSKVTMQSVESLTVGSRSFDAEEIPNPEDEPDAVSEEEAKERAEIEREQAAEGGKLFSGGPV